MIAKIKSFFSAKNSRLELISEIIFLFYLVWVTIPFVSTRVPILFNLTSGGSFAIVYRAIGSLVFAGFFAIVAIVNKFKVNKLYLIAAGILLLTNIIGTLVLPNSVIYGDGTVYNDGFLSNNHYFHISEYTVGYFSILKGLFRIGFGLVFGYVLLFIVPKVVGKKLLKKVSIFYVGLLALACFLSFILETSKFKSGNILNLNLSSIFASKNDFGAFLIIGSLACLYLQQIKIKFYKLLYIPLGIFMIFSIVSGCKTSLLFAVIILFYILATLIKKIKSINEKMYKISQVVFVSFINLIFIFFILLLSNAFPSLSGLKQKVDFALSHDVAYTLTTRFQIWSLSFKNTNLFKILFGQTWSYGPQHLYASSSFYIGTGFTSYHNSLVCIFTLSGLFGLVFYLLLIVKSLILNFNFKNYLLRSIIILICTGLFIFSMVEDDLIFINGSGFSLFYSIMLSPIGKEKAKTTDFLLEVNV